MEDLGDGESTTVKGSGSAVHTLKNSGGVYSCTCPAWRNQSVGIERRTCKHLRALRGDPAETARLGSAALAGNPPRPSREPGAPPADQEGPRLLLAQRWETDVDITGWWMSEKLDGVRAYWDGERFLSRLGNQFYPPDWFVDPLPRQPLDGELWGGRKLFQRTVGIVKRQDKSPLWEGLVFAVFDAPAHDGPFEARLAHASALLEGKGPFARIHEHVVCGGVAHLREELARVEALGGEGLMARRPGSRYEAGRSTSLLKVKSFRDAEARVVGHIPGAGKHTGRLGALALELADGTRFHVGTGLSDAERERPPAVGSLVTFRYQELSDGGVPRFPSYVGERFDARGPSRLAPPVLGAAPASPPPAAPRRRRFERQGRDTRAFWELEVRGDVHLVRFGTFEERTVRHTPEDAGRAEEAAVAAQLACGFTEVDPDASGGVTKERVAAASTPRADAPPSSARRRFEFVLGGSSKFWAISVEGSACRTWFGRLGTNGQKGRREWSSPEQAAREAEKLIAEKTAKGYREV